MRVGVLGTGIVGRTLSGGLAGLGHEVVLGTRDPSATRARAEPDPYGTVLPDWLAEHPTIQLGTFADAAAHGEMVVNATAGQASLAALAEAGSAHLAGKVLLDVSNDLDFSGGFPPLVGATPADSLAERIQRAHPEARVVKSLNTLTAALMTTPDRLADGEHTVFVSGDDPDAKASVTALLRAFGWRDIIDLGPLASARSTELLMPMWLSLLGALGLPPSEFQFRIVR